MSTAVTVHPLQPISSSSSSLTSSPSQSAPPHVEDMTPDSDKTIPLIPGPGTSAMTLSLPETMDSTRPSLSESQPIHYYEQSTRDLQSIPLVGRKEHQPACTQRQQRELLYNHHLQYKQKQQKLLDMVSRNHQQYPCPLNQDHERQQVSGQGFEGSRQQERASRHMGWQGEEEEDEEKEDEQAWASAVPPMSVGSEGLLNTPFFCSILPTDARAARRAATEARLINCSEQGGATDVQESSSGGIMASVDLVDDVWRTIFYMLAQDCKDLGRCMQVNRRFHK